MTGIGIDTTLSGIVGAALIGDGGEDGKGLVLHECLLRKNEREETYRLVFENTFACDEAGTASAGFAVCARLDAGLDMLTEAIDFLIAPIAAVPAAEAFTLTLLAVILGKTFCTAGLG
jgi:hypothetical protein